MPVICRVIAGVSGSPRNLPALRHAAAVARDCSVTLIPVHAWIPPGGELAVSGDFYLCLRQEWEDAARERLSESLMLALGGLPADVPTHPVTARGDAGRVLVHAARRPGDLLVIGTGRQGVRSRLVGGNISRYCLAHADCPVLAVPPSPLELEARHGKFRNWDLTGITSPARGELP